MMYIFREWHRQMRKKKFPFPEMNSATKFKVSWVLGVNPKGRNIRKVMGGWGKYKKK